MPSDFDALLATIPFAACPMPDVVAAGQPSPAMFTALAEAGYRTVLDLRGPHEPRGFDEPAVVRETGLDYVSIPVTATTLTDETFDRFRAVMRDPATRPMIVHCGSASRVGALLLPYFILDLGMSRDEAVDLAMRSGLRVPDLADVALAYVDAQG